MIIQCDFDGTITRNNLSVLLREKYAHGDWHKIDADYLHGRLTVEQSNKLQFALSSGLDFYIETVLAQIGMPDLELHCGQTSFGKDGIAVSYTNPEGSIIDMGFKRKYLSWLKKRGENIIYIGDGLSDLEAAHHADHVFATGIYCTRFAFFDNSMLCLPVVPTPTPFTMDSWENRGQAEICYLPIPIWAVSKSLLHPLGSSLNSHWQAMSSGLFRGGSFRGVTFILGLVQWAVLVKVGGSTS